MERHRQHGAALHYAFDVHHPTRGWAARPGIRDMRVWGHRVLNTNARGLRGRRDYAAGRHPTLRRVLVLGDSFTFGDEVSDHETWCHYLQEMLPDHQVINAGVHGYGHDQMLLMLQEEGLRYAPDLVLLGFVTMDMGRNLLTFRDFAKPRFLLDGDGLRLVGTPVPTPQHVFARDWLRPRVRDLWALGALHWANHTGARARTRSETTRRLLDTIARLARSNGAAVLFAYLPVPEEIRHDAPKTWGERFLFDFCEGRQDLSCMTARPHFARARGRAYKKRGHWQAAGHLTIAEAVHDFIAVKLVPGADRVSSEGGSRTLPPVVGDGLP
jgi:hypothetical protein